ncbi:MAG: replication factor C large subunit [Desulfurococcales archaeon]|nr:replication factor C large subunit [Desulfurococcales archaeon]
MSLTRRASRLPWVIKYRPKRIDEVEDQEDAKRVLIPWLKQWLEGRPPAKKAALLYGPPGVGKTSLVEAAARELGFEVLELNASDYRRASDIRKTVGKAATKRPLWGKGLIILLDEIDGISAREDAGGLSELMKIIPETRNPIIMTANDPWKEQLRPLRELVVMIEFKQLTTRNIVNLLERICKSEKLYFEKDALRYIAERSEGDVRAAINDLEAVAEGYGRVTLDLARALVKSRDKTVNLWKTLTEIFYAKYAWATKRAVSNSEEDYETLITWISDNIPRKYSDIADIYRAYDALSRATLFLNRAKYGGSWALLSYVFDLMGPGVGFARKGPHARERYKYPEKIRLLAQMKAKRESREKLAEHLSRRLLTSKATIKNEVLPFLYIIFRNAPTPIPAARISVGYRLTREEIEFLAGPRAQEILKAIEKIKRAGRLPEDYTPGTESREERKVTTDKKLSRSRSTKTQRRRQRTLF